MAVTRLRFYRNPVPSTDGVFYIDLARELSRFHRKLHRQKMIYTVYGGYFVDNVGETGNEGRVDFNVAPDTWYVKNSINRAFRIWKRQIAETLANFDGAARQKYSDFKVFLNADHTDSNMLSALDARGSSIVGNNSEWNYTSLFSHDFTESLAAPTGVMNPPDKFEMQIVGGVHKLGAGGGDEYERISLIKSWLDSRPIPQQDSSEPDYTPDHLSDPLSNLFDTSDTDDDIAQNYELENDLPPFDPGEVFGAIHDNTATGDDFANLQTISCGITSPGGYITTIPGFTATNGLIQVRWNSDAYPSEFVLDVESKGVAY